MSVSPKIDDKATVGVSDGNDHLPLEVVLAMRKIVRSQVRKKILIHQNFSDADVLKISRRILGRITPFHGRGGNVNANAKINDASVSHKNISRCSSLSLSSMYASVNEAGTFDAPSMSSEINLDKIFDTFGEQLEKAIEESLLAEISTVGTAVALLTPPEAESVYTLSSHRSLASHDTYQSVIDAFVAAGDFEGAVLAAEKCVGAPVALLTSPEAESVYTLSSQRSLASHDTYQSVIDAFVAAENFEWAVLAAEKFETGGDARSSDKPLFFDSPFFALSMDQPEPELKQTLKPAPPDRKKVDLKPTKRKSVCRTEINCTRTPDHPLDGAFVAQKMKKGSGSYSISDTSHVQTVTHMANISTPKLRRKQIYWENLKCEGGKTGLRKRLKEVGESRIPDTSHVHNIGAVILKRKRLRRKQISWESLKCGGGKSGLRRRLTELGDSKVEYQTKDDLENDAKGYKESNADYGQCILTTTEQKMRYQELSDELSKFTEQSGYANTTRPCGDEIQRPTLNKRENKTLRKSVKVLLHQSTRVLRKTPVVYQHPTQRKNVKKKSYHEMLKHRSVRNKLSKKEKDNEEKNFLDMEDDSSSYKDWDMSQRQLVRSQRAMLSVSEGNIFHLM